MSFTGIKCDRCPVNFTQTASILEKHLILHLYLLMCKKLSNSFDFMLKIKFSSPSFSLSLTFQASKISHSKTLKPPGCWCHLIRAKILDRKGKDVRYQWKLIQKQISTQRNLCGWAPCRTDMHKSYNLGWTGFWILLLISFTVDFKTQMIKGVPGLEILV